MISFPFFKMTGNVMKKLNIHVKLIKHGVEPNVFPRNGYVMVIQIVLMVLMKIQQFIIAQVLNHVVKINLPVQMGVA